MEIDERNARRDERVLDAAWLLVETKGLSALTRDAIAFAAGVSAASVSNFGRTRITNGEHDSESYRTRIMRAMMNRAIETGDTRMLRVGLVDGCLREDDIPMRLRGTV